MQEVSPTSHPPGANHAAQAAPPPLRLHSQVPEALLKTRAFDSLESVLTTGRDACGGPLVGARNSIMRCSAELFNHVHHNTEGNFKDFFGLFEACRTATSNAALITPSKGGKNGNNNNKHPVIELAEESVIGANGGFMAPMCSPLTQASCSRFLRTSLESHFTTDPAKSDYYVTEKSDGLRVIMVSQLSYNFPQWRILLGGSAQTPQGQNETSAADAGTQPSKQYSPFPALGLGLYDVAQLERAFGEVEEKDALKADASSSWTTMSLGDRMVKRVTESAQFRLSSDSAPFVLRRVSQKHAADVATARSQLGVCGGENDDILVLVQKTDTGDGVERLIQRRLTKRSFSYVFDRTMAGVFLVLDEMPFSNLSHSVLDGELILTTPQVEQFQTRVPRKSNTEYEDVIAVRMKRQLLFAVFDIFSFATVADDEARKPEGAKNPSPPKKKDEMQELCRSRTWERYVAIENVVLAPMYASLGAASQAQRQPIGLCIMPFRKQMWPIERLPECIRLITTVPTKDLPESKVWKIVTQQKRDLAAKKAGAAVPAPPLAIDSVSAALLDEEVTYLFAGKSYNDGLIFTPADFDVVSGSRPNQLKWKFPDKLTVDWTITKLVPRLDKKDAYLTHAERGGKRVAVAKDDSALVSAEKPHDYYKIEMFFKRRGMGSVPELSGSTEFHRSRPLLNPHGFEIPDTHGVVAECTFQPKEGRWCIERLRRDKTESNSVHTIISVLESIAEKIDVLKLLRVLSFIPILSPSEAFGNVNLLGGQTPSGTTPDGHDEDDGITTVEERRAIQLLKNAMSQVAQECELVKRCRQDERTSLDAFLQAAVTNEGAALLPQFPKAAYLSLKNSRGGGLTLQWQVKLSSQRNAIAANHCKARECYGLGEPCPEEMCLWAGAAGDGEEDDAGVVEGSGGAGGTPSIRSKLKQKLLIELGNQGGSTAWSDTVVECVYDPTRGRWGLVDFASINVAQQTSLDKALASGATEDTLGSELAIVKKKKELNITKNNTYATQLVLHLEAVCTYVYSNAAIVDFWSCINTMRVASSPQQSTGPTSSIMQAFERNPLPLPTSLIRAYDKLQKPLNESANAEVEGEDSTEALERLKAQLADAHYAARTRELRHDRKLESPLRCFNNWIKMMLMQRALAEATPRLGDAFSGIPNFHPGYATFEACCGRGGDLFKWKPLLLPATAASQPGGITGDVSGSFLFMADVCEEAVAEAASRYSCAPGLSTKIQKGKEGYPGVPAYFFVEDCFSSRMIPTIEAMKDVVSSERQKKHAEDLKALKLSNALVRGGAGQKRPRVEDVISDAGNTMHATAEAASVEGTAAANGGGFDFVSIQFSMHYGFYSKESVRRLLRNVSVALRPGGIFFGTTVDDAILEARRKAEGDEFGNKHYMVSFSRRLGNSVALEEGGDEDGESGGCLATNHADAEDSKPLPSSTFGTPYSIQVENAVSGEVEYTVPWGLFVAMCADEFALDVVGEASVNFEEFAASAWAGEASNHEVAAKLYKESFKGVLGDGNQKSGIAETEAQTKKSPQAWLEEGGTREAAYLYRTFMFRKRI